MANVNSEKLCADLLNWIDERRELPTHVMAMILVNFGAKIAFDLAPNLDVANDTILMAINDAFEAHMKEKE